MIDILGKTHFRSTSGETSGETSDKKSTQKIFYCTKKFVIEFEGESLELLLSYLVYFRRYRHFRPSSLKKRLKSTQLLNSSNEWKRLISGLFETVRWSNRIIVNFTSYAIWSIWVWNRSFDFSQKWIFFKKETELTSFRNISKSNWNTSKLNLIIAAHYRGITLIINRGSYIFDRISIRPF